jgi:DHA1 family bicyclomycin/chloramphenicol resistance-like MFS transporter
VRDLHTGNDAARLMSLLMLVFSVSPILAPLVGSAVIAFAGWRGVFWVVTIAAVVGLATVAFVLKETRPAEQRVESSLGGALRPTACCCATRTTSGWSSSAPSRWRASSPTWQIHPS